MIYGQPQVDALGFSITSAFKKAGGLAVKTVTVPTKYAYKATRKVVDWTVIKPTEWLTHAVMAPVRNRVQKMVHRRAAKIAYDNRKSTTPTPAEVSQARSWTKSKLKGQLPHGPVLAVFAGPPEMDMLLGGGYQFGVAPAVAAAAVPILMAVAQQLLSRFSKSGEAPENPAADARADATAPDAPAPAGTVDLQPAQDAAADAADAASTAIDKAAHPNAVKLPGGMHVDKKTLMIGGAVVGGVILLALFMKKKPTKE